MAKKPPVKKAPKAPKNPIGDFLKGEADKRKLPVVTEQKPKARGNPNRAKTPGVINQGHTPGSASRAVVPYKAPASKLAAVGRVAGSVAKVLSGPVGLAVGMVADSKPAGAGSDKPSGPLMKGNRVYGGARHETPGSYPKGKAAAPKTRSVTTPPHAGLNKASGASPAKAATPAPKPTARPSRDVPRPSTTVPKPTARPSMNKGPASGKMSLETGGQKRGNVMSAYERQMSNAANKGGVPTPRRKK